MTSPEATKVRRMVEPGLFVLTSGRRIYLRELRQWSVYEGLLEGLPTREDNAELVERIVAKERERARDALHVVAPRETPVLYPFKNPYPFGEPSALPSVACVARFGSTNTPRHPKLYRSTLTVVWFQQEFAMPIDPAVRAAIEALDWDRLAVDEEI